MVLVIFDCIRLKSEDKFTEDKRQIICIYNDDRKYYGIGYSYEVEEIWTEVGRNTKFGFMGTTVGHYQGHFKLLYFIPIG